MTDRPRWLIPLAGAILLAGCGGGGGDSGGGGGNPAPSAPPTVTLTASPANVSPGGSSMLAWSSTNATSCSASVGWSGTRALSGTESTGPLQQSGSYRLTCTGAGGTTTAQADVTVDFVAFVRTVRGTVTYGLVPHSASPGNGLAYSEQSQVPARAITVEAIGEGSGTVLATTSTDDQGRYGLSVDTGAAFRVRARAELSRAAPLPAPHWSVQVSDLDGADAIYTYAGPAVPAGGADVTQDLAIPSGWGATGSSTGTRDAAPFAILDAMYRAMTFISQADPGRSFPALRIDWAPSNIGGETFYQGGSQPAITVSGQVNADTDEYDWHIIVHEYAHYLEDQFSRSDSIGGPHAFGDILDPRVAFSEGFAYAFAAMVLGDPVVRDSFGMGQTRDSHFNVETNTTTNAGWFSESSVQEVVYDYYDAAADPHDTLSLPFATLWNVMTGPQRTTPALTTLFPFVTGLRLAAPGSAAAIDSRLVAELIDVNPLDDFGSGETHLPVIRSPVMADVLPIYAPTNPGATTTVRSTNKWGTFNALSNSRFLRFSLPGPRSLTITASTVTLARDIDFLLFRTGALVVAAEDAGSAPETRTLDLAAGDYVLEVYDCDNVEACSGTAQPIDIDVTLQ